MDWLKWLGDLSPIGLFIVALWIMATKIFGPLLSNHKEAIERLTKTQEDNAERMGKALDANTEVLQESVKHNETIITNHLGAQAKRDSAMIRELRAATSAIEIMNERKRLFDKKNAD